MLNINDRPTWRVIKGGSRSYLDAMSKGYRLQIRLNTPVTAVRRDAQSAWLQSKGQWERFDAVFMACHSDQALRLLTDPSIDEQQVLSAIPYTENEAILHTDESLLPQRKLAWAAWNYHIPKGDDTNARLTYHMNILQDLPCKTSVLVSLNSADLIRPETIIHRVNYQHPLFTPEAVAAQGRQADINYHRTFYCGAYWRNGFHEDGVVSALQALKHFQDSFSDEQLSLPRAS